MKFGGTSWLNTSVCQEGDMPRFHGERALKLYVQDPPRPPPVSLPLASPDLYTLYNKTVTASIAFS